MADEEVRTEDGNTRDADTSSLDFGIWNQTGQDLVLVGQSTPNSHWHNAPWERIGNGQVCQVTAGSNSINGVDARVTYQLADKSVKFWGSAGVPPWPAKNWCQTGHAPSTTDYREECHIGSGTMNVTGDWKFIKTKF
jgi:hypothetical protein